jgi:phosphocarrier protein FPr
VQLALSADATIEVRNATTGSPWVPASSLSRCVPLGALSGHELELRAWGPGPKTPAALVALAGEPDGEPAPALRHRVHQPAAPSASRGVRRPGAVGVSRGIAIGPARPRRPERADAASYEPADPRSSGRG